jgi:hypothetical protein
MNCKRCGAESERWFDGRIPDYCVHCIVAIVLEWQAAQDEPIPFEVEKREAVA